MKELTFRFIQINENAYRQMMALRMRVLLAPIGIPSSYIDPQKEAQDTLIGAFYDEELLGCCILTRLNASTVQLRQMAVDNSEQRTGIGRSLIAYAEEVALEKGFQQLLLHARDTVFAFYEKCGYTAVGEPFFEVGIGHRKMVKNLFIGNPKQG